MATVIVKDVLGDVALIENADVVRSDTDLVVMTEKWTTVYPLDGVIGYATSVEVAQ